MEYQLILWICFITFNLVLQEAGTQELNQYGIILNRTRRNHESDAINHGTRKSSKKANHDNTVRDIDNSEYKLTKEHYSSLKPKSESSRDNIRGNNPKVKKVLPTSAQKLMPSNLKHDNVIVLDPRKLQNLHNVHRKSTILKSNKDQTNNQEFDSDSKIENKLDNDNLGKIKNQKHPFHETVDEDDVDEPDIEPVEPKKNKVKHYNQSVKSKLASTKNETKGYENKLKESKRKISLNDNIDFNLIKIKPNSQTLEPKKTEHLSESEVKKTESEPKEPAKDKIKHNNPTTHINIESNPSVELELDTLPKITIESDTLTENKAFSNINIESNPSVELELDTLPEITIEREILTENKAVPTKATQNYFEPQESTRKETTKVTITHLESNKSNNNSLNEVEINVDSTSSDQKQGENEHIVIKQKWAGSSETSPTYNKYEVKQTVPYLAENTRPSVYIPSPYTSYTRNNNLYNNNLYKQNCGTKYRYPSENTSTLNKNKIGFTKTGHIVIDPKYNNGQVNERNSDSFKDRTWRYFKMTQIDMNKGIATNINTVEVKCPNNVSVEVPKQATLYRRPECICGNGCYGNGNTAPCLCNCCYYPSYTNSL